MMHNIKNTSDFIELLEIEYPEKALALLGMDFHGWVLGNYLNNNVLNEHSFEPKKFKVFLEFNNTPYSNIAYYNSTDVYNIGDIVLDNANVLKIFNGNEWLEFTTI